jgi:hypothetical protein
MDECLTWKRKLRQPRLRRRRQHCRRALGGRNFLPYSSQTPVDGRFQPITAGNHERAPDPRFRRSRALSRTWWQVKDSNLRSFRDGFTDQRRQARDQRKRSFHRQLTCAFPTDTRRQPTAAGHPGEQFAFPTSPYDAEPDPSTRVATMVEVACQLNSVLNSPAEFRVPSRRCPQSGGGRGIPGWRIRARACSAMRRARR